MLMLFYHTSRYLKSVLRLSSPILLCWTDSVIVQFKASDWRRKYKEVVALNLKLRKGLAIGFLLLWAQIISKHLSAMVTKAWCLHREKKQQLSATDSWVVSVFSARCQQWLLFDCCKQCFPNSRQNPASVDFNGKTQLTSVGSKFNLLTLYFKTQNLPEARSPSEKNNS